MSRPDTYGIDQRRKVLPTAPRRLYAYLSKAMSNGTKKRRLDGATLAKRLGMSLRSVRYALADETLRERVAARGYTIAKERHGRTYFLYLVRVQSYLYREQPKGCNYKHRQGGHTGQQVKDRSKTYTPDPKRLKALAFFLSREWERSLPWDNCKVKLDKPMLYLYALDGLYEGLSWERLEAVLDYALHERHAQATDEGLSSGSPGLKYECSSTISLAREVLKLPRKDRTEPKPYKPC